MNLTNSIYLILLMNLFIHYLNLMHLKYLIDIIRMDLECSYIYELLIILLALQSQSETTQPPMNLSKDLSFLDEIIKNNSEESIHHLVNELIRNYRIKI